MKRKRISRMLAVLLAFTMVFTMMPAMVWADGGSTSSKVSNNIANKYTSTTIIGTYNEPWFAADLAAYAKANSGTAYVMSAEQKQVYLDWVIPKAEKATSPGDLSKYILSLVALRYDPTNITTESGDKVNAVKALTDMVNADSTAVTNYFTLPYVIIALSQDDAYATSEQMNKLLKSVIDQKSDWMSTSWGPDAMTAMLLAIAGHTDYEGIPEAIEESKTALTEAVWSDNANTNNANSLGLALAAFSAIGVDPNTVVKDNQALVDRLLTFKNDAGDGFLRDGRENAMATEQAFRGLIATNAYKEGGYNLYDFSDHGTLAPAVATKEQPVIPDQPPVQDEDLISVWFTLLGDEKHGNNGQIHTYKNGTINKAWIEKTAVKVAKGSKAKDVIEKALTANNITSVNKSGHYISEVNGLAEFDNGPNSGWLYNYNGVEVDLSIDQQAVNDGDSIVLFYTDDYTKEKGAESWLPSTPSTPDVSTSGSSGSATTTTTTQVAVKDDTATATVKDENAKEIIKQAEANMSKEIVIDVKKDDVKEAEKVKVDISVTTAKDVLDKTEADLTVNTPAGSVTLTQDALKEAVAEAKGKTISVEVALVSKPTEIQQNAAGINGHIIAVTITSDDKAITTFGGKTLTIKSEIPAKLNGKTVIAIYIADDGKIEKMTGKLVTENGKDFYEFETPHLSTFALADADEVKIDEPEQDKPSQDEADKAAEQKAKIKKVKTTLTLSTKGIKKGIKVTVKVPESKKADKTGIIIYRSTSKNAKPYAVYKKVSTKGSTYIIRNTKNVKGKNLTKGKTYYYKARAYKVINGKTYYGPMSAIKSIKAK